MSDIPIIGETQPLSSEPSLTDEDLDRMKAAAEAAGVTPDKPVVTTAFIVIVGPDGTCTATPDLSAIEEFTTSRQASADDMYSACSVVCKDIALQETAVATAQTMMQISAQIAQQQQQQALLQQVQQVPNLRG